MKDSIRHKLESVRDRFEEVEGLLQPQVLSYGGVAVVAESLIDQNFG